MFVCLLLPQVGRAGKTRKHSKAAIIFLSIPPPPRQKKNSITSHSHDFHFRQFYCLRLLLKEADNSQNWMASKQFLTLHQSVSNSHVITATHYLSNAHQQEDIHKQPHHIRAGQSDFKHHTWKKLRHRDSMVNKT